MELISGEKVIEKVCDDYVAHATAFNFQCPNGQTD